MRYFKKFYIQVLKFLFLVLIILGIQTPINAQTCNVTSNNGGGGPGSFYSSAVTNVGNSFTACQTGTLSKVKVLSADARLNITLKIYQGEGVAGTLLGTFTGNSLHSAVSFSDYSEVDVSSESIQTTSGSVYTFYYDDLVSIYYCDQSMVTGGQYYEYFGGSVQAGANFDLYFEVEIGAPIATNNPPTLSTTAVTVFDATSASLGGDITDDGGASVTERGVVYSITSTNDTPEIGGTGVTDDPNGDGTGTFSKSITGLTAGTEYSVQAYATNSEGTSYGGVETFTTETLSYYMAKTNGDWSSTSIWYTNSTGGSTPGDYTTAATQPPTAANSAGIIINADVAVDASVSIDQTTINSGATLTVNSGATLTIADGIGDDLTITGAIANNGIIAPSASTTVVYNGGNQTIHALDYSELVLTGTGSVKTFADGTAKVDQEISLTDDITLTGSATIAVTVQVITPGAGGTASRVFNIDASGKTVNIENMTIKGGDISSLSSSDAYGGGIYLSAGTLNLDNAIVSASKAASGGGVFVGSSTLTINNSAISNNISTQGGGGLFCSNSSVYLFGSTFNSNTATSGGGGIRNENATVTISNSTISDNITIAEAGGIAILAGGSYNIKNSTIAYNHANNDDSGTTGHTGGGIFIQDYGQTTTLDISNSIVAINYRGSGTSTGSDYYYNSGTLTDNGYNVIENQSGTSTGTDKTFTATTNILFNTKSDGTTGYSSWNQNSIDLSNQTLGLSSSLADNGGPTQTLALTEGSFAAASAASGIPSVSNWNSSPLIDGAYSDQRGVFRMPDQNTSIGAYSANYIPLFYYYMAKSDGNWNSTTIWFTNTTGGTDPDDYTTAATETPNAENSVGIIINADVDVDADVTIDQTTINSAKSLTVNSGQTLSIVNGEGDDLSGNGTLLNNGQVSVQAATASIQDVKLNSGSTFSETGNTIFTINGDLYKKGALNIESGSQFIVKSNIKNNVGDTKLSVGSTNGLGISGDIDVEQGADTDPPVPGNSGTITTSGIGDTQITLNWTTATDNTTTAANLQYLAYYSTSNNISSYMDCETNGNPVGSYAANISTKTVTGLNMSSTYYFNVVVKDEAGNKAAYSTKSGTTTCFVAGTKITMADGSLKNIEDVVVGDVVESMNVETGKLAEGMVLETFANPPSHELTKICFNDGIINTNTITHPYWVDEKGWCCVDPGFYAGMDDFAAEILEVGDKCILLDGEISKSVWVTSIEDRSQEAEPTYNFHVANTSCYFANGVLVHNKPKK